MSSVGLQGYEVRETFHVLTKASEEATPLLLTELYRFDYRLAVRSSNPTTTSKHRIEDRGRDLGCLVTDIMIASGLTSYTVSSLIKAIAPSGFPFTSPYDLRI